MLDLKKLEEKLDKALANETTESLTNWLQEKRLRTYLQSLGEGTFENIIQPCNDTVLKSNKHSFEIHYCEFSITQDYPIAA
jgi:hypothetical protein